MVITGDSFMHTIYKLNYTSENDYDIFTLHDSEHSSEGLHKINLLASTKDTEHIIISSKVLARARRIDRKDLPLYIASKYVTPEMEKLLDKKPIA